MKKLTSVMLLIFFASIIAISTVSAADDNGMSDIASMEENQEQISQVMQDENNLNNVNENEAISDEMPSEKLSVAENDLLSEPGHFSELNNLINGNNDTEISLDKDYINYWEVGEGIVINRTVTINGNGFTLDGHHVGRIFYVSAGTVLFKNINFINADSGPESYGGAIYASAGADVTALGCNFTNNAADYGGAICGMTAINCRFENNHESEYYTLGVGAAICDGMAINCYFKDNWVMKYIYDDDYEKVNYPLHNTIVVNCVFDDGGEHNGNNRFYNRLCFDVKNFTSQWSSGESLHLKLCGEKDSGVMEEISGVISTVHIYQNGNEIDTLKVASGNWVVKLPIGEYNATVNIANNNIVESCNFTLKISKGKPILDVNNITIGYKTNKNLTATLKTANGTVLSDVELTVDIDGNITHPRTDNKGQISISLNSLSIGQHSAFISFMGNNLYEAVNKTVAINVTKIPLKIDCDNEYNLIYNATNIVIVTLRHGETNAPISGFLLNVDLNGTIINSTTDENGQIKIDAHKLGVGTHITTISFNGTENYSKVSRTINIKINRQKSHLYAQNMITSHQSGKLWIVNLTNNQGNPISGAIVRVSYQLSIGEVIEYNLTTNEAGQIEVPTNEVPMGQYRTYFEFDGNENYSYAFEDARILIDKYTSIFSVDNITACLDEEKYLTITLKDDMNRTIPNVKITVFIKDLEEKTTDENGTVKISTKGLEPNNYHVLVQFEGNRNFSASNCAGMIVIEKNSGASVDANATNYTSGQIGKLNIAVTDAKGIQLNGTITVEIDGEPYKVENITGIIEFVLDGFSAGEHTAHVIFTSPDYLDSDYITHFTVNKISTAITINPSTTITYNKALDNENNYYVYAILKDSNGKLLANKMVQYSTDGKLYTAKTDSNGQIKFLLAQANQGQTNIVVSFAGDDGYTGSIKTLSVKVNPQKVKLAAKKTTIKKSKKTKKLTATLKNSKGKAIAGKKITFTVNKKAYTAKTNKKGVATVKVKLSKKKTYKVTVKFAGDNTYSKATKKTSVKIK